MKKVGLYIPCYNAQDTLARCIEAALAQSYPLQEIVVIDDGSTDGSREIIRGYAVKFISHHVNRGLAASRNDAVKNLTTDFVASVDADCVLEKDWLALIMEVFVSDDIAGAGGSVEEAYRQSAADEWRSVHMKQGWDEQEIAPPFLFGSNTVFRREALERIGFYDRSLGSNYEDVDISQRLMTDGYVLRYVPQARVFHLKEDSVSSVVNNFWRWQLPYYIREGTFSSREGFLKKIGDNFGLANRFLEEDLAQGRGRLAFIDLLFPLHHSMKDIDFFNYHLTSRKLDSLLPLWLSLIDFSLQFHLKKKQKTLTTLLDSNHAFLQNFIALSLISGGLLKNRFKTSSAHRAMTKELLLSLYGKGGHELPAKIASMVEHHCDWTGALQLSCVHLEPFFFKSVAGFLKKWIDSLSHTYGHEIESALRGYEQEGKNEGGILL